MDTIEGPRAPAVKLTARHSSLTRVRADKWPAGDAAGKVRGGKGGGERTALGLWSLEGVLHPHTPLPRPDLTWAGKNCPVRNFPKGENWILNHLGKRQARGCPKKSVKKIRKKGEEA